MKKQDNKKSGWASAAAELSKNKEAVGRLAKSEDAQRLMAMLRSQGEAERAADAAAAGDPTQIMSMMKTLMQSGEGAALVDRIRQRAEKEGLSQKQ